ncbi:hypothetical protein SeLEV6574_g07014 [Synchytrium endobioticum]|nr:hypothetical protein SeLEV6574_g07014 [Synchytrium endobioticum]
MSTTYVPSPTLDTSHTSAGVDAFYYPATATATTVPPPNQYTIHRYLPHSDSIILDAFSPQPWPPSTQGHSQIANPHHYYNHFGAAVGLGLQRIHDLHRYHPIFTYHPPAQQSLGYPIYGNPLHHPFQSQCDSSQLHHQQQQSDMFSPYDSQPHYKIMSANDSYYSDLVPGTPSPFGSACTNQVSADSCLENNEGSTTCSSTSNLPRNRKPTKRASKPHLHPSLPKPLAPSEERGEGARKVYACTFGDCPKIYGTGAGLRYHLKTWHKTLSPRVAKQAQKEAKYICNKCAKSYSSVAGLRYHTTHVQHTPEQVAHAAREADALDAFRIENGLPLPPKHPTRMKYEVLSSPEVLSSSDLPSPDELSHLSESDITTELIMSVFNQHFSQGNAAAGTDCLDNSEYIDTEDLEYIDIPKY